ncbi:Arc family DNA-binding protein [Pseudomonas luteola]|uniref:Arc family DNA-binding protein n=1 Tax=Pseudomonas luteola TaxID=47886 RepID=UPI003A89435F
MEEDIQKTALRLPRELHNRVHEAAKNSGRSMNAEIVSRLQESFAEPLPNSVLIPASKAKVIAANARKKLSVVLRSEILSDLNGAISSGLNSVEVDLSHTGISDMNEDELTDVFSDIQKELAEAGYASELVDTVLVISF